MSTESHTEIAEVTEAVIDLAPVATEEPAVISPAPDESSPSEASSAGVMAPATETPAESGPVSAGEPTEAVELSAKEKLRAVHDRLVMTPEAVAKLAEEQAKASEIVHPEDPEFEVRFPAYVEPLENMVGYTGQIGSLNFVDGRSVLPVTYHEFRSLSAGLGKMLVSERVGHGVAVHMLHEGSKFSVSNESKLYRAGDEYPAWLDVERPVVEEEITSAASVSSASDEAKERAEAITQLLSKFGAKFVRQFCTDNGVKTARSGEELAENLFNSPVTLVALKQALEA